MSISLVQKTSGINGSSSTSLAVAYGSNVTAGNLLILIFGSGAAGSTGVNTIVDTQGNTWTTAVSQGSIDINLQVVIAYAIARSTGPNTVTVTSFTSGLAGLILTEYSGLSNPSLDTTAKTFSGVPPDSIASGNVTTAQAIELLIASACDSHDSGVTWSVNNSFTVEQTADSVAGGFTLAYADFVSSTAGTYSTTFSATGLTISNEAVAAIAAFKGTVQANPTHLEISLFGVKRFGKIKQEECRELPSEPKAKLFQ